MKDHGSFSKNNPKTEWLESKDVADRDMKLIEEFSFTDPVGKVWIANKDKIINGASIPPALWSHIGSPYTGDYRRASIVHDVACGDPDIDRKKADEMFFHACRAGGCDPLQARILYVGVRIGAWAKVCLSSDSLTRKPLLFRKRMDEPSIEEKFLQGKLSQILYEMNHLPDDASTKLMDDIIEQHLNFEAANLLQKETINNKQKSEGR